MATFIGKTYGVHIRLQKKPIKFTTPKIPSKSSHHITFQCSSIRGHKNSKKILEGKEEKKTFGD